jgi:hypothetical protein
MIFLSNMLLGIKYNNNHIEEFYVIIRIIGINLSQTTHNQEGDLILSLGNEDSYIVKRMNT